MADKQYTIKVGYSVDDSGLKKVKQDLQTVQDIANEFKLLGKGDYTKQISALTNAFDKSANFTLGKFDSGKFVNELKKSKLTVDQLRTSLNAMYGDGQTVFNHIAKDVLDANIQLRQTPKFIQEFQRTFTNVFRYNLAGMIQNAFTGSFQQAIGFAKSLDSSLNDIRIVTGKSADEMARFSKEAASAAKSLGKSTTDYTNASLIYYQQGLSENEVKARTETTLKAANVTGQSTDAVSQELTAVWNGYKLVADETEAAVDKLAAVAATTASNLEELSTGMSKVASAANTMGVDFDQLNAQIATIISVTRQAPESVGTALKTIYARMSTIEAGGMDEEGNTLTSYTEKMNNFGISVLDQTGHLRDMGDVMEEIGQKWQYMNKEQQVSLAQAMAGTRQYNNLMALFENWDMYSKALNTSQNALGTLQKQQNIYMDSLEAHLKTLETAKEEVFNTLIDTDSFKDLIDTVTTLTETLNTFFETFGGGLNGIMGMMAMFAPMFKTQIAGGITSTVGNIKNFFTNKNLMSAQAGFAQSIGGLMNDDPVMNAVYQQRASIINTLNENHAEAFMSQEEYDAFKKRGEALSLKSGAAAQSQQELLGALTSDEYKKMFGDANRASNMASGFKEAGTLLDTNDLSALKKSVTEARDNRLSNLGYKIQDLQTRRDTLSERKAALLQLADEKDLRKAKAPNAPQLTQAQRELQTSLFGNTNLSGDQIRKKTEELDLDKQIAEIDTQIASAEKEKATYIEKSAKLTQSMEEKLDIEARKAAFIHDEESGIVEEIENQRKDKLDIYNATDLTVNALATAAGLYSSIGSITAIISDDTDSIGEKIGKLSMVLMAQVLPSVVSLVNFTREMKQMQGAANGAVEGSAKGAAKEVAKKGIGAKIGATVASALGPILAVAIGAAVVAGFLNAINQHEIKKLEKKAEKAKEELKRATEQSSKSNEEAEALRQIEEGYDELQKQLEDGSITKQDVIDKTYDLCIQYGQEDLAVRALCGSYENLNDLLEENSKKKNEQAIADSKMAVERAKESAKAEAKLYNKKNSSFFGLIPNKKKSVSASDATNLALNYDEIQESVLKNPDSKESKEYLRQLEVLGEQVDVIRAEYASQAAAQMSNIGLDMDNGAITSQAAYVEALKNAWTNNSDFFASIGYDEKEFYDEFNSQMLKDEELSSYAQKYGISQQIADEAKISADEVNDILKDADTAMIQYVSDALSDGVIESKESLEEILKEYDEFRGYFEKNPVRMGIESGLAQLVKDGTISEDTIAQIFSNGNIGNMSQDQFSSADVGTQTASLLTAQIFDAQNQEQARKEALEEANRLLKEAEDKQSEYGGIEKTLSAEDIQSVFIQHLKNNSRNVYNYDAYGNMWSQADLLENITPEDIAEIARASKEGKTDSLTDKQKQDLEIIKSQLEKGQLNYQGDSWEDYVLNDYKVTGNKSNLSQKEIKENEKSILRYKKKVDELKKAELDYKKTKESVNAAYKQTANDVDHLQSQYQGLVNIVKDYNDNNKLSVDNVQTLLTMDNAFVASLEFQGDQLAINGQTYESLMDIQKAYMKEEVLSQMITDLAGLSQKKAIDLSYQLGNAQKGLSIDVAEASAAAQQGTVAFTEYASALAKAAGVDLGNISKDEAEFIKATENRLKMLDAMTYYEDENSKSKKNKEEKKEYDDEFDRYWDLKKAIDKVTQAIERLDEAQEHLHGPELIKSLQNENKLLEKQKETYVALGKEQEKEAEELRKKLGDSGFLFDSEGQITNYKAQTQQMLQDMQAITDKFNQGGYDEDSYNAAQKKYEKIKKNLERYDTLFYSEMVDNEKKLREIEDAVIDNNMQAWETDIQVNLDLSEAERQWNDFFRDIQRDFTLEFEDISKKNAVGKKDFDTYTRAGGTLDTNIKAIRDIEADMDAIAAGGTGKLIHSIAEGREKVKELATDYRNNIQEVYNLYQEAWENYLATIDQGSAKLEKLIKEYDLINQKLEFQSQLIQLIYGKQEYDLMDQFYTAQRVNSEQEVDSLRQQTEMWKKLYEEADEGSQDKAKYYDLWIDKQNQLNDLVIKHIEMLKNEYSNTVESIFNKLEKTMTNNNTFSWMKEQWDLAKKSADGYYDDVERIYELETMENKWKEAIDKADSNKSQKMLNELMNTQLDSLREKEKLSEYDITLAEKRLAVAKAQAALDDAQNAKNTMKVTRGTDGNWSYQYVADEDDVLAKQQALLDAQHEAYEFAKKSWEDMQASIISDTSEALESIKKLELEKVGASEEEIALIDEKIRTIEETYWGPEGIITQHKQMAAEQERMLNEETAMSVVTAYNVDQAAYEQMTTEEKALLDELRQNQIDSMQDVYYSTDEVYNLLADEAEATNARSLESWTTLSAEIIRQWNSDDEDSVRTNILSALGQCQDALVDYGAFLDILAEKAGMDFGEAGISGQIAEATLRTELLNDQTAILVETIESDLANALEVFENMQDEWMNVAEDTHTAYEELENYLHTVGTVRQELADLAQIINEMQNLDIDLALSVPKGPGNKDKDNTNPYGTDNNIRFENYREGQIGAWNVEKGNWEAIGTEQILDNYFSDNVLRKDYLGMTKEDFRNMSEAEQVAWLNQHYEDVAATAVATNLFDTISSNKRPLQNNFYKIKQFDTGGYTGAWGSDGRLAILDEKELVLNKEDTSNMLSLVDILRGISKSDVESMMQLAFADGIVGTAGFGAITNSSSSVGGNTFNITAEFPNANDVNEIRQAILSLPNLAAQYINKK